jgi:tetratricopeptide (TPR) repeat protein
LGQVERADTSEIESSAAAVVLEEQQDPEELIDTVVLDEEELEETVLIEEEPEADKEPIESAPPPPILPEAPKVEKEERPQPQDSMPVWRRYWPALLIGAAVIAVLIMGVISGWFGAGTADCGDLGQCVQLSNTALGEGDIEASVELMDQALRQVSFDEEPAFADLWCRQGELYLELGRMDEAIQSYEICAGWTHNEPDMEGVRMEAQRRLDEIMGD